MHNNNSWKIIIELLSLPFSFCRRTLTISRELGDRAIEAQVTMNDESPPYIVLACGT